MCCESHYLFVQMTLNCVNLILSIITAIPMVVHQNAFSPYCALGSVVLNTNNTFHATKISWSNGIKCYFSQTTAAIILLICLYKIVHVGFLVYKDYEVSFRSSFFDVLLYVFSIVLCFANVSSISIGLYGWCESLVRQSEYKTCKMASLDSHFLKHFDIDSRNFLVQLSICGLASLFLMIFSIVCLILALLKFNTNMRGRGFWNGFISNISRRNTSFVKEEYENVAMDDAC